MLAEFTLDTEVRDALSSATKQVLQAFPEMLVRQENLLREYHKDTPAVLFERTSLPLDNFKGSTRLILTRYLTKTVYYSRSIIESVNSKNLLVAFQCMRTLLEVVAAVRYSLGKMRPIIHDCSARGMVTADEARQLNYHCDLLLPGGQFDWQAFFEEGAWAMVGKKNQKRTKQERQEFGQQSHYLRVGKCLESWSKDQPLAGFAYDYLCDLVHLNKGSNLIVLVERQQGPLFDVEGPAKLEMLIFDKIFALVVKLCANEFADLFMAFATMGADEVGSKWCRLIGRRFGSLEHHPTHRDLNLRYSEDRTSTTSPRLFTSARSMPTCEQRGASRFASLSVPSVYGTTATCLPGEGDAISNPTVSHRPR
jgi:hypothetical protein